MVLTEIKKDPIEIKKGIETEIEKVIEMVIEKVIETEIEKTQL